MVVISHKGGISFGLVYIPTALYAATKRRRSACAVENFSGLWWNRPIKSKVGKEFGRSILPALREAAGIVFRG